MKPCILWIHGLNCASKIFTYMHSKMPAHNAVFVEYDSQRSVENSIKTAMLAIPEQGTFSIVGHSLGGILGHLIATRNTSRVDNLVTISTPFGGSDAAGKLKWFYPSVQIFKDIAPRSSIIKELTKAAPTCPFLSIVSEAGSLPFIVGKNDGVVSIESQMSIKPTHRLSVNSNHFEAVQDIDTLNAVKQFIFKK